MIWRWTCALTALPIALAGCGSNPSPTPKTTLAKINSENPNNQTCSATVQYDCGWLTLTDKTTGLVVADRLPMDQTQYLINNVTLDAYELRVNIQVAPGVVRTASVVAEAK